MQKHIKNKGSSEYSNYCDFQTTSTEWLNSVKPQLKKSSIIKYQNILNLYLLPEFCNMPISDISRKIIIAYSSKLLLSGGVKKSGLSPTTVNSIITVIKNILEYAERIKGCSVINLDGLYVKQNQHKMRILSRSEQEKLSKYLCNNLTLRNMGILVCLYTGLRIGEICALRWQDISFEEHYICVRQTMQRIQTGSNNQQKTEILITDPKSTSSERNIPVPNEIFEIIAASQCQSDTYFLTGTAAYIEPRTLQNHFKSVLKRCNITDANFHSLRHTFATRCIELGFDVKSLSEILGHASVNITMNRYVHPSMELKQKNMNMLSELIKAQ